MHQVNVNFTYLEKTFKCPLTGYKLYICCKVLLKIVLSGYGF